MKTVINTYMKHSRYIIALCLLFNISLSFGQNSNTKDLERPELKKLAGVWVGKTSSNVILQLELNFEKVYYERGNFLVDQLVGFGYLINPGNEGREPITEIAGADLVKLESSILLKLKSFDFGKEKYIELILELHGIDATSGELTVKNKETILINGKVNGKKWDGGFSLPTQWKMRKIE